MHSLIDPAPQEEDRSQQPTLNPPIIVQVEDDSKKKDHDEGKSVHDSVSRGLFG